MSKPKRRTKEAKIFAAAVHEIAFSALLNHIDFYKIDQECGELYDKLSNRLKTIVIQDEQEAINKRKKATQ